MSRRDSIEKVAASEAKSGKFQRRTPVEDHRPYQPEKLDKFFMQGRKVPFAKAGGDGLVPAAIRRHEDASRGPQFVEDMHYPGYHNDVPLDRWTSGANVMAKPGFDHVGNPNRPKGLRNSASGQDAGKSPFSAAHKTWSD